MMTKHYQVKELAELAGVTVRALHHYDEIGLLRPTARTAAGYRLYDQGDLLRLQQILISRELGLSLVQVRVMLDDPDFDHKKALLRQRRALEQRVRRSEGMLVAVDLALAKLDGNEPASIRDLFDGFDPAKYEKETEQRWGQTEAYKETGTRTRSYSTKDWQRLKAEGDQIIADVAALLEDGASAHSDEAISLADKHRLHIHRWFYPCSHAMHSRLAEMYVNDERFANSFDVRAKGLSLFFADAIRANESANLDEGV